MGFKRLSLRNILYSINFNKNFLVWRSKLSRSFRHWHSRTAQFGTTQPREFPLVKCFKEVASCGLSGNNTLHVEPSRWVPGGVGRETVLGSHMEAGEKEEFTY